jgi:hypothetical protein
MMMMVMTVMMMMMTETTFRPSFAEQEGRSRQQILGEVNQSKSYFSSLTARIQLNITSQ